MPTLYADVATGLQSIKKKGRPVHARVSVTCLAPALHSSILCRWSQSYKYFFVRIKMGKSKHHDYSCSSEEEIEEYLKRLERKLKKSKKRKQKYRRKRRRNIFYSLFQIISNDIHWILDDVTRKHAGVQQTSLQRTSGPVQQASKSVDGFRYLW